MNETLVDRLCPSKVCLSAGMKKIYTILLCGSLFFACSKKETDPTPQPPTVAPQPTTDLSLLATSAVPGEVVLAQANFALIQDTATIMVGSKNVLAMKADGNRIAFILPELPANSTAAIQYKNMGITKSLTINVGAYTPITQPDVVINTFLSDMGKLITHYEQYENRAVHPLDPAYGNVLQYVKDNFAPKVAALKPEERKQVAYVIQAYALNANQTMGPVNPAFYVRTQGGWLDAEDSFLGTATAFVNKNKFMVSGIALLGIAVAAPVALGVSVPLVAATGAVLFVWGFNDLVDAQATLYSETLNTVGQRTQTNEPNGRTMVETLVLENGKAVETLVLENGKAKELVFKGRFRTLVQSDSTSSAPAMKNLFQAYGMFETSFGTAKKAYETLKKESDGPAPEFPAANAPIRTSPLSKRVTMSASKLSITNISNPAIKLEVSSYDTVVTIKANATGITQDTPFTFDLVYTSALTGGKITDKIHAEFKLPQNHVIMPGGRLIDFGQIIMPTTMERVDISSIKGYCFHSKDVNPDGTIDYWPMFAVYGDEGDDPNVPDSPYSDYQNMYVEPYSASSVGTFGVDATVNEDGVTFFHSDLYKPSEFSSMNWTTMYFQIDGSYTIKRPGDGYVYIDFTGRFEDSSGLETDVITGRFRVVACQ